MSPPTTDPVLDTIRHLRIVRDDADACIRVLLAYAREVATPRPYRLVDLADAAGMSVSGVRVAYRVSDIHAAGDLPAALTTRCRSS
jgi:hypothetical protein